ncbi:hypothetical protein D3C81_11020 [compost metagenome]
MAYKITARLLKELMKQRRTICKGTLKDLNVLIECKKKGNYTEMFKTKLYTNYSGEYCEYLEIINSLQGKGYIL